METTDTLGLVAAGEMACDIDRTGCLVVLRRKLVLADAVAGLQAVVPRDIARMDEMSDDAAILDDRDIPVEPHILLLGVCSVVAVARVVRGKKGIRDA
jgi:hypothetical protein